MLAQKLIFTLLLLSTSLSYGKDFQLNLENFKDYASDIKADNRAIEGSSPILGHELVMDLKNTDLHPAQAYQTVLKVNHNFDNDIYTSVMAYIETMTPGLDEYCSNKVITGNRSQWTVAKGNLNAAIPQEVITPLTQTYIDLLDSYVLDKQAMKATPQLMTKAQNVANNFQQKRYNCPNVKKLERLENKMEKFCLGLNFCVKAKKINHIISSAEAAYPRKQFSINGFTRYVYDELLKTDQLEYKLQVVYDTEVQWLDLQNEGKTQQQFFEYVIDQAVDHDIHIKDVMLILAYSMRNMPSLDVEYATDPKKALLLETYFWGFRDLRSTLSQKKYFEHVFADHKFKRNPGFYHYLTAALLGCEARLAGLSKTSAIMLGLMSKVGYKTDKLIKAIEKDKYQPLKLGAKITYLKNLMKKQGTWPAIAAGMHAASFGSKSCKSYIRKLKKNYRADRKEVRKSDLTHSEKVQAKQKLKEELKKSYRSLLDSEDSQEE